MKRFWEAAEAASTPGGFAILLDGRPMRLPGGGAMHVARAALARAIAAEWQLAGGEKGGSMKPEEVPLTRLVGTAAERIAPAPAGTITALARYGETDLLCYRAEDGRLAARQTEGWDPWLRWSAQVLDAPLVVTTGIMPVPQSASALAALRGAVAIHDPLELAALGVAVPALGSLVLGLAVARGVLPAAEAMRLSALEEDFQAEFWGVDPDTQARRASATADVALAGRFFDLLRA